MFESGHELLGNNLYAYCNNNPINMIDPDGESILITLSALATILAKAIVVTAVVTVGTYIVSGIGYVVSNIADSVSSSKNTTKNPENMNIPTITSTSKSKIYNTILQVNKHIEPPSKLKDGDFVKNPISHPKEFTKNKNRPGYTHNKTGWQVKRDPSNHGGPHWDMNPPRGSGHINVGPKGNIFGGSR